MGEKHLQASHPLRHGHAGQRVAQTKANPTAANAEQRAPVRGAMPFGTRVPTSCPSPGPSVWNREYFQLTTRFFPWPGNGQNNYTTASSLKMMSATSLSEMSFEWGRG